MTPERLAELAAKGAAAAVARSAKSAGLPPVTWQMAFTDGDARARLQGATTSREVVEAYAIWLGVPVAESTSSVTASAEAGGLVIEVWCYEQGGGQ